MRNINGLNDITICTICYFIGAIITYFIKVYQPSIDKQRGELSHVRHDERTQQINS
ncbi:hypothetical protein [Staphylococcus kloosii]|uniref:hypothetical protein n=1 Tax=Staphylococcus kloosii TaxID=29384 RepID=UPI00189D20D7|nr:hypothetical protein [Staphylococcus kloosii]MBF7025377.1 hypothetical protein [Staphylococcus kloosii]